MTRLVRPWRQDEPYRPSWRDHLRDAIEIIVGIPIMLVLFVGIPWLLWIVAGTP